MRYDDKNRRDKYAWSNFARSLRTIEDQIKEYTYTGILDAPVPDKHTNFRKPKDALTLHDVDYVLTEAALSAPHGFDLLTPVPPTKLPRIPPVPDMGLLEPYENHIPHRYEQVKADLEQLKKKVAEKFVAEKEKGLFIAAKCRDADPDSLVTLLTATLRRHPLPTAFSLNVEIRLDTSIRVVLCEIEIPDLSRIRIVKQRKGSFSSNWYDVPKTESKRATEKILHSLCIRAGYLIAMSDPVDSFDTVAINANQRWFDPATGVPREGIIASIEALKSDLCELRPGKFEANACFRHLKGITTPNPKAPAPIRPIFVLDKNDQRIVENKDVATDLADEANLAAMPWEDFEHLIRQLFEWMFHTEGIEVNITRASRDRGVDAIVFDPDPIRGGKYVIQAKRYTRPVDVAAVRDLYGTVVNEGANRGILVTTASYGPDAYEFAKDKPISLVDGPNLLVLLKKHGRKYRIDLNEARRLEIR